MNKRSQVNSSKKDRDSNLKQRVEIRVDRGEEGLFTVKSTVPLSLILKGILKEPRFLFAFLLTIIIAIAAFPLLVKALTANINIPPVISLAIILLALIVVNFVYFGFFHNRQLSRKSMFSWDVVLLIICNLIFVGILIFVYLSFLIRLTTSNLGIPEWLSAVIILLCPINFIAEGRFTRKIYGLQGFNLPLYVVFSQKNSLVYQPWLWWWLKNRRQIKRYIPKYAPESISKYDPKHFGVNVLGGLIPIAVACWQFIRVAVSPILLVTAVTTVFCYFSVKIIPNRGICIRNSRIWTIVLAISILTSWIGDRNHAIAIAYAGITLGSLIGADLLHLKDFRLEQTIYHSLSIGGAGFKDAIVLFGLYVLLTIEFWEQVSSLISG